MFLPGIAEISSLWQVHLGERRLLCWFDFLNPACNSQCCHTDFRSDNELCKVLKAPTCLKEYSKPGENFFSQEASKRALTRV